MTWPFELTHFLLLNDIVDTNYVVTLHKLSKAEDALWQCRVTLHWGTPADETYYNAGRPDTYGGILELWTRKSGGCSWRVDLLSGTQEHTHEWDGPPQRLEPWATLVKQRYSKE